ncbi:MAG: helix-turn-helix transcriptional regulator [Clostridia bacterium]|nr:helix-turn-helix transcriptional regulator [Clostridia bacterium]
MKIGKRLREEMKLRGITQRELAMKLWISQPTVSQWVTGVNEPSCEMIVKICKVLEITPNELFDWE